MAYIEERKNGWLVVWRDPDNDNKKVSRLFKWNVEGEGTGDDFDVTKEQAREHAEMLVDTKRKIERRGRAPLARVVKQNRQDGADPLWEREDDKEYRFETYLHTMIERNRDLRKSTRELYLRNTRVHIKGTVLGRTDIRRMTPKVLSDFWAGLPDDSVGARRNVHQLLSMALNRALQSGLIDVNPLKRAPDVKRPPRSRKEEVDPLTADQVESLADHAKYKRDRLEILVMAYGGLRAGEVGGLRAQDILRKGERCQLRLRQQVVRVTGEGQYIEELKTKAGKRVVDIPCSVAVELETFAAANPPAADGRVFHGENGSMRAHNAILHGVKLAGKAAGLPATFSHQLRHTAVSFWIEDGANPKDIQRMVGHASIRETLDTYGHLFDYGGQALAEGMQRRRDRAKNGVEAS
jgi:integrase